MMKLIVMGGKGTAVNIAEHIIDANKNYGEKIELLGYAFDDPAFGEAINGYPILSTTTGLYERFGQYSDVKFIFALYKPDKMRERVCLLKSYGIPIEKFYNFIHPSSYKATSSRMGYGNVILSNSSIQSNVQLGDFNIINSNVVVEHDTSIGNNNFISSSSTLGSFIKIESGVFIGLNSSVREHVCIEDYAFVGMSSNVLNNVKKNTLVIGNPAKVF